MRRLDSKQSGASLIRSGFTLIELIVVMGIIAVIVSMVTMAVSTFQSNARVAATQTLLKKLDGLIRDRQTAVDQALNSLDKKAGKGMPSYVNGRDDARGRYYFNPNAGNFALRRRAAVFIARKRISRQAFPQRFSEVDFDNDGNTDPPFNNIPASHNPNTESAELLYWFLTESQMFDITPVGTGDFSDREVADTDGDGFKEFVDAWGRPLRFYRWPTRLIRPGFHPGDFSPPQWDPPLDPPADRDSLIDRATSFGDFAYYLIGTLPGYDTIARDPDDSLDENCRNLAGEFVPDLMVEFQDEFHTPRTWHVPMIISAGEDGTIGLYEPNDVGSAGNLAYPDTSSRSYVQDDLTNLTLRAGGN